MITHPPQHYKIPTLHKSKYGNEIILLKMVYEWHRWKYFRNIMDVNKIMAFVIEQNQWFHCTKHAKNSG